MKPIFLMAAGFFLLGGCSKAEIEEKSKNTNNPMTNYAQSLHDDVDKAREAAEKANKANEALQKELQRAQEANR